MAKLKTRRNRLRIAAQFALFSSSYLPLSILLIVKMLFNGISSSNLNNITLITCIEYIALALLFVIFLFGTVGLWLFIRKMNEKVKDGFPFKVKKVHNKKAETIGYIATYIIPFILQSPSSSFDFIALLFFLCLIFLIYRDSALLTINPVLSIFYSIYEIEFEENGIVKNGIVIIKDYDLNEEDKIIMCNIGRGLYFGKIDSKEKS